MSAELWLMLALFIYLFKKEFQPFPIHSTNGARVLVFTLQFE